MLLTFFQIGSRKRKFLTADDSPIPNSESRQSSIENVASPTPKRRRGGIVKVMPKKRTRSSFTEDVPTDPDISFVGETQLSFGSSTPDSQFQNLDQEDELVGPTPYAGARAPGIFDVVREQEEEEVLQDTGVDPEPKVVSTLSRRRRGGRRSSMAQSPEKLRTAKVSKKVGAEAEAKKEEKGESSTARLIEIVADSMDIEAEPESEIELEAQIQVSSYEEGERAQEVVSGAQSLDCLRKSLQILETTKLTSGECREAENLVFDAFAKLRERGHSEGSD